MIGRWYETRLGEDDVIALNAAEGEIANARMHDGKLVGTHVQVSNRAVLVNDDGNNLSGDPIPGLADDLTDLRFDPSSGGARARENRRARGAFNDLIAQAHWFAMVNAYVHTDRAASYVNGLLADIGAQPIPQVAVIVGAHFGSRLEGFGCGDGDRRHGELRPLSGGHYRLSQRTNGVPELEPVDPVGEIHLGPSRYRKPFVESAAYLRNAAHNPAIIYHEFGHHVCRHTADFRLNSEREPDEQRNGKPGIEEGICDYIAAMMLGSGRPYGWYRADRGQRRDLAALRPALISTCDGEDDSISSTNAHAIGAPWAAAFWSVRQMLGADSTFPPARSHDLVIIDTLARVGRRYGPDSSGSAATRERRRNRATTIIGEYRRAIRDHLGLSRARQAMQVFETAGLRVPRPQRPEIAC